MNTIGLCEWRPTGTKSSCWQKWPTAAFFFFFLLKHLFFSQIISLLQPRLSSGQHEFITKRLSVYIYITIHRFSSIMGFFKLFTLRGFSLFQEKNKYKNWLPFFPPWFASKFHTILSFSFSSHVLLATSS